MARLQRKKTSQNVKKKFVENADSLKTSENTSTGSNKAVKKRITTPKKRSGFSEAVEKNSFFLKISQIITKISQFFREVKIELKKVTWPTRKQTVSSTIVVIVLVFIISLFLGLVDFGLSSIIRLVLH